MELRRPSFLFVQICVIGAMAISAFWPTQAVAQTVVDQHGVSLPLDSIEFPDEQEESNLRGGGGGAFCNTSGIFNVYFWEVDNNTGTGFDDAVLGVERRDVVCRAFTDLSLMLQPADDPYLLQPNTQPFVNITMLGGGLPAGALAAAQVWHNTIALPDFDANPLNNLTEAVDRQGVLDGEVWRTINGGRDSWEAYELAQNNCANYEHGRISVNFTNAFHLDPSTTTMNGFDLYRIIVHEAFHLLGFYSHSTSIANSFYQTFPDPLTHSIYYSRFDLFLNDGTQALIVDPNQCDWTSNTNAISTSTQCGVFFEGGWTTLAQPIFSPVGWMQGSSMSHLDNACAGGDFLMHWSTPANDRLIPSQIEANILCDIGYHTTSVFGDPGSGWDEAHASLAPCGTRLAGVDDIYDDPTTETFYTMVQGTSITMSDFLDNDEDESSPGGSPTAYDCMTILQGGGSFVLAATSFDYTPDPDFVGWAILRYVPLNNAQDRSGNLTYIYIEVRPEDVCASQTCNIVNGGDFEHSALSTVENASYHNWRVECGNSPDLVVYDGVSGTWVSERNFGGGWPWVNFYSCPSSSIVLPSSHNGTPANDQYMALIGGVSGNPSSNSENVMFELCRPLMPGDNYTLEYWIYGTGNCGHGVAFDASEFRPCNQAQSATDITGGPNSCVGNTFATVDVKPPAAAAPGWNQVTHTFTYAGTTPGNWLMCYMASGGGGQNGFGTVFVDDISIRPEIELTATIGNACGTLSNGAIHLVVEGGYGPFVIQWSNGATGPDVLNVAAGSYDVVLTDGIGCTASGTFIVGTDPCDPFTLTKSVNDLYTYAGAPVLYTISVCNSTTSTQDVVLTDSGLSNGTAPDPDFVATSMSLNGAPLSWPGFPATSLTIPNVAAGSCAIIEIAGYFTSLGEYTNCVVADPANEDPLTACAETVTVLQNCPLVVFGSGNCAPGSDVQMCLGIHSLIADVKEVNFLWVFPTFLDPPLNFTGASTPALAGGINGTSTIGPELPWASMPGYSYVAVHLVYNTALPTTAGIYSLLCIPFELVGPITPGVNLYQTFASNVVQALPNHRVDLLDSGGMPIQPGGLLTQAANVILTGCPGIVGPNAEFTIDQVLCTGEVSVTGALTDPNAIHMWTWGDDRTTPTNGAQTYTYNYFAAIPINQTPAYSVPPAPPGTYTITHTVILNGVASTSSQQVTIAPCCVAATVIPDGSLASVVGTVFSGTVDIQGQFIVDDDVLFMNCQVYMEPGAEIIVQNGWILDIDNASFTACNGIMWKSITAEDGSTVRIRRSYMDDAESTIAALDGSVVWVDRTQFHNNRVGVGIPDNGLPYNNVACWVSNSTFYSAGPMPQPYTGQASAVGGVGFAAVDVHNTTLDFSGGNNMIHSLSNGIVAHRSDVNVNGCQMLNIQPDAAYAYTGNGAGIYARGGLGFFSLKQQGYGVNGLHSFQDCRWGIYTEYMSVKSTDNRMFDVGTAYRVDRSGYMDVDILNNKVSTRYNGIDLRANDGAAHILVQGNDITFGNDPSCTACRGWYAVYVSEGNYVAPNSRIQNNTIHFLPQYASRYGIGLFAADRWIVAENDLGMTSNAFNRTGIWLNGCRATEVSCNTVSSTGTTYPVDAQAAIRNNMGREPLISCNEMDQTANGILFNGVAYNTDVRGNQFHDHRWPLHLDATAIIDVQTLKGNLWDPAATTPVWGAWYEVSILQAANSAFEYDPANIGSGTTVPPSWSPINWFNTAPGPNYDCAEHHGMHYCSQFGGERCKDCIRELDEKIASDSLENDPYTDETKWMLAADLYKKLDESPALLDSLPELDAFYTTLQGSATAAFKAIADDQLALYGLDSSVVAQLQANRIQIETFMTLVKDGLEHLGDSTLTPAQRQTILGGISGYRQNINSLTAWNATALQVASASKVLTADGVKAANSGIATSELIETNEKGVNDIYLATIGKDVDDFTATQTDDLFTIANQCPMVGGNAVFKARSLYWLIDDTYDFDDQLLCLQHGIIVKSLTQQALNGVAVVPNPASDEATLVLDRELEEPGMFVVYDAVGAEVMRQAIPIEMPRMAFSTASLAPALYHYQVRGPSGIIGVGKLTIVR